MIYRPTTLEQTMVSTEYTDLLGARYRDMIGRLSYHIYSGKQRVGFNNTR